MNRRLKRSARSAPGAFEKQQQGQPKPNAERRRAQVKRALRWLALMWRQR